MSAKNNNKLNIPEAKAAMNKFKMEAAAEMGVNLKDGYNGDLTSREAAPSAARWSRRCVPHELRTIPAQTALRSAMRSRCGT